ncbi:MAG: hypothetical protein J6N18_05080, partial [Kiritimatiellae bacterium]|nr:hypothetical protein [Kiritimatiellia bacterium]
ASTGCVELVGHSMKTYPTDIYLGAGSRAFGTFRLGGETSLKMDKEVRFGLTSGSLGCIELADTSSLAVPESFGIHGYVDGASAVVSVTDEATLTAPGELLIGCTNKYGCLKVQDNAKVLARKISIAYPDASKDFVMLGDLEISGSAVVSNVAQILLGRGKKALGTLKLNGGSLFLDYRRGEENSITLGSNGGFTDGVIRGWGWLGFDDAKKTMVDYVTELGAEYWAGMTFCGQIIADGGVLDFSRGPVPTWAAARNNDCGTNGFFAVNKGLLKLQRSLPRKTANHKQVGMMPSHSDPVMVNTFRYTFDTATMNTTGTYVFSELYAVDRSDIPAGLPTGKGIHHSVVWRIGHFNASATPDVDDEDLTADHKQNFTSLKLKFHYDPALAEIEGVRHVKVYRCTDSVNGGWTCVASITAPDSASPYIETVEIAPSSELWNGGWFAIVGTPKVGTVMVVR